MEIKLVAIDMDGTLLRSNNELSDRVKNAVISAAQRGVKIIISTGRIYQSAKYYSRLLGIDSVVISCNGAFIKEYKKDSMIFKCSIPNESLVQIANVLNEYNDVHYRMYSERTYYAKEYNQKVYDYMDWNGRQIKEDQVDIRIVENPMDIAVSIDEIFKLFIGQQGISRDRFDSLVSRLNTIDDVYCVSSIPESVDVINKRVSKGNALEFISGYYDIPRENMMAIGDNYNDIEMIQYAGIGVAMGNAENALKDVADFITTTNMEDGVALAIEKFVLKG